MKGFILDWLICQLWKMLLNQYMKRQIFHLLSYSIVFQADKFGENAFWSFDVVVQQGLICVWLFLRTGSDNQSCVNASILHITCSRVLSHVWPPLKLWFSQETPNWIRNAMSTTFPGSKNYHNGRFELRVCFITKVWCSPWSQESSSGSCQTSSQGFEILSRTVFPAPAPFRSIELFRLGRWTACHTADSFNRPTCDADKYYEAESYKNLRKKESMKKLCCCIKFTIWMVCLSFAWLVLFRF